MRGNCKDKRFKLILSNPPMKLFQESGIKPNRKRPHQFLKQRYWILGQNFHLPFDVLQNFLFFFVNFLQIVKINLFLFLCFRWVSLWSFYENNGHYVNYFSINVSNKIKSYTSNYFSRLLSRKMHYLDILFRYYYLSGNI